MTAPHWHALSRDEALQQVGSVVQGLTGAAAAERKARFGANVLPRGKKDRIPILLWRQIDNPLIWVLIVSGGVSMLLDPTGGVKNGLVILGVVVLNTIIGFVQEFRAGQAIEELTRMVPETVTALRDGHKVNLDVQDLVRGDVVLMASGDRVPADVRVIQSRNLRVDQAALTGESVPVAKHPDAVPPDLGIADRTGMAYAGTLIASGTATALVVETGHGTELGRISMMLKETTDLETPLTRALGVIGTYITVGIVAVAVVILVTGTWRTVAETDLSWVMAFRETVIFGIALAVGAIPEGLPAIVTIALAIGVRRMAKRNAVVRRLPAVETLGSTTVICTDKTGTLTRNEMTVQELWAPGGGEWSVSGIGYEPKGALFRGDAQTTPPAAALELLRAGAQCNDASLSQEDGRWVIQGDPTEAALLVAARKLGVDLERAAAESPRLDAIPFESENRFMATLHPEEDGRIFVKGSPETVLERCSAALGGPLDAEEALHAVEALAGKGMRVLAFAVKPALGRTHIEMDDVQSDLVFLGLQGMMDPARPEALKAIGECHRAGIVVKMITGDHPATARAIAGQLDIPSKEDDAIETLAGLELDGLSPQEFRDAARQCNVFARVAPEHKLRLVQALQSQGHVVAMTGDGVNDAPALKQADIGVAMGLTGTSVSKASAAVVLADDNFASIAAAVEEGRRVYDNLIKSLAFVLPTNLGLALILMWAVAFFPFTEVLNADGSTALALLLPMSPTQLLWINLVAAVALALPLAFEAREPNLMNRAPRDPGAPVLSGFVIARTVGVSVLMTVGAVGLFNFELEAHEMSRAEAIANAQTMAVTAIVAFQIFYLLNCRSLRSSLLSVGLWSNPIVFLGIGVTIALQCLFIYAPFMNSIFGSAPLPVEDLLLSLAAGAVVLPVVAIEKWWRQMA